MTTLADIMPGQQFLFVTQCTGLDPNTGMSLALFGPNSVQAATATIAPDGTMTGPLSAAPSDVPVNLVTGLTPIGVGDVLENQTTGETMVARWSNIDTNGNVSWSALPVHDVVYSGNGWSVIGHVDLTA